MILHSVITQQSICGNNVYKFCMAVKMGCMAHE